MAMGKREAEQQQDLFITHDKLPRSPGHVFYRRLNQVLAEGGFDRWVEGLCELHYCKGQGPPSVPPGVYFRMLLVGYFEGINSQRGIAHTRVWTDKPLYGRVKVHCRRWDMRSATRVCRGINAGQFFARHLKRTYPQWVRRSTWRNGVNQRHRLGSKKSQIFLPPTART
jgi:hypothetical protein